MQVCLLTVHQDMYPASKKIFIIKPLLKLYEYEKIMYSITVSFSVIYVKPVHKEYKTGKSTHSLYRKEVL